MKKKTANIVMVAIIIAVALSGIFGVGHIKGWFDKSDESTAVLKDFRGIITFQRDRVAYATTDETVLRKGDKITCDPGATVKIALGESYVSLGQNADAEILNPDTAEFALKVNLGEAFVNSENTVILEFEDRSCEINNAVATLSVRKGAQSISVYYGSVNEANAGEMLEWIGEKESVRDFSVKSLNDFNISQIIKANETKALVFSNEELDELEAERWEQMHGSAETTAPESTVSETVTTTRSEKTTTSTDKTTEPSATVAGTTVKSTQSKTQTTTEKTTKKRPTTTKRDYSLNNTASTTTSKSTAETTKPTATKPVTTTKPTTTKSVETTKEKLTCTITIRCDTILDNTENLDPAKAPYVPDNGVILREVTVEFEEGETVFDVLNRACKRYNIPIEYSWTPLYDSYYIEGINNLYEFDCGTESGWMYKVNGWFPNYGCSSYYLTGGETIVWCYTCNGLGKDVGAERWE